MVFMGNQSRGECVCLFGCCGGSLEHNAAVMMCILLWLVSRKGFELTGYYRCVGIVLCEQSTAQYI